MNKDGIRDEKRQYRLSLLGLQQNRSDESSDDGRTERATNEQNESSTIGASPPSSQASISLRAEKQASQPSMFGTRNSFLVGGESKSRIPSVARMPSRRSVYSRMSSRRSVMSDVETGGIMRGKEPRPTEGPVGDIQRKESHVSIPGAFRMHPNGTIDDDPTVYSQNTKETNPFVIDHASLIENPDLRAHLASGGAVPTDFPPTNSATGGPAPDYGAYPMPTYALNRTITPNAMPSSRALDAPIGVGVPVTRRRNQDGLRLSPRQIRLMFLMLAVGVVALVTGVVAAIDNRSNQEFPVNSVVESPRSNEKPLDWNDDGVSHGHSNDAKDVMNDYINELVFPTQAPTVLIKDSRVADPTPAPSVRATYKPTVEESESPTEIPTQSPTQTQSQSPTTPSPTALPTTPKPTEPLETSEPSVAPTEARPSSSPSTSIPSSSPSMLSSSTPSVTATTATPTSLAPSHPPTGVVTTLQPTTLSPTTLAPSEIIFETEGTIGSNATNTTGEDIGNVGQNSTNTTDEGNVTSFENVTQDFWRDQASIAGEEGNVTSFENVTQDFWRDQASIAGVGDSTPLNWSQ